MSNNLSELLKRAVSKYKSIFGDSLVQVILYGSYARGDFDEESDVDIVALVRCDRETISCSSSRHVTHGARLFCFRIWAT